VVVAGVVGSNGVAFAFVAGVRCNNFAVNVHWLLGIVAGVGDEGGLRSLIFVVVVDWMLGGVVNVFDFPCPYWLLIPVVDVDVVVVLLD
uniref:Uncharacterized protein n=1 Tax=Panagrolaimus sp. ES5 TaxID=591445 RepID=A0AC34GG03_9BILA